MPLSVENRILRGTLANQGLGFETAHISPLAMGGQSPLWLAFNGKQAPPKKKRPTASHPTEEKKTLSGGVRVLPAKRPPPVFPTPRPPPPAPSAVAGLWTARAASAGPSRLCAAFGLRKCRVDPTQLEKPNMGAAGANSSIVYFFFSGLPAQKRKKPVTIKRVLQKAQSLPQLTQFHFGREGDLDVQPSALPARPESRNKFLSSPP